LAASIVTELRRKKLNPARFLPNYDDEWRVFLGNAVGQIAGNALSKQPIQAKQERRKRFARTGRGGD
jgi:hypothetical protein